MQSEPGRPDFLRLSDSAVLVTGASSGIGRAAAIEASRYGARLALVARRESALNEVLSELDGDGHAVFPFDVTNHAQIPDLFTRITAEMGPLNGLVHAAGVQNTIPIRTMTPEAIATTFDINVTTAFMMVKGFRNKRVRGESPSVVLMSSTVGIVGQAGVSIYSATKGAITALTRSLALELSREGIRVNSVAPAIVATPLTDNLRASIGSAAFAKVEAAHPIGIGEPIDVANAILYLLSPSSRWVIGSNLVVDGGYTAQ